MERLTKFVQDFKGFMAFIKDLGRISDEYIKRFEKIFSVTEETLLLREIQDMKDELNMLAAVFSDQLTVLQKAGADIAEDRKNMPETRSSAFNFEQQSEKHARHVRRMHVQASQAYDTVSHSDTTAWKISDIFCSIFSSKTFWISSNSKPTSLKRASVGTRPWRPKSKARPLWSSQS
jgi:hypothetical protein